MRANRQWMYDRIDSGEYREEFFDGVEEFISLACQQPSFRDSETIEEHLCEFLNVLEISYSKTRFLFVCLVSSEILIICLLRSMRSRMVKDLELKNTSSELGFFGWLESDMNMLFGWLVLESDGWKVLAFSETIYSTWFFPSFWHYEEFVARRAANPSKSDAEVFYEVVGGYQNGSVYGLGSSAPIYYDRPSSSRASKTGSSYAPSIVTMLAGHLEQLSGQVARLTQQLDARRSHDGQSQGTRSEVYRPDMNFGDTVVPDSQLEIPDLEQTCHAAAHNPFYFPHDPPPPTGGNDGIHFF